MYFPTVLCRHYHAASCAIGYPAEFTAFYAADRRAVDCAALYGAILAAAAVNRRRPRAPGAVLPGTKRRAPSTVAQSIIPPLARHAVAAAEACSAEMTCNGHAASLRAYDVARHYARVLWPR